MYRSLNDYIARLESEGELVRIKTRVSPVEEIAEITDRVSKTPGGGRALLFENTGTEFPVLTNLFGSVRRMALALGVERLDELSERIEGLLKEALSPRNSITDKLRALPLLADVSRWFPHTTSGRGACQQVVQTGAEASLAALPILKCWPADGGRFVTLPMVNTLDPETGARNVGMYRMQVLDDHTTGMHWHIHKTGARHYDAYKRLGQRMPVSVALGGDPTYTYAATAPMPDNMDEYLLAGFLRRRAVKLVKCITNDIYVPADCDFVIEGYVDPTEEKVVEGPFGDHTGFYSLEDRYPRFHVTAVTHRRDAVYPATVVGVPPQEDAYIAQATERIFLAPIRLALQPEVRDLTMPEAGTAHNIAVVSIDSRYAGQAVKVAQALWGAGQMMFNKYMFIVPPGTDVRDPDALAALVRRIDPVRDLVRSEGILDVLDHATATPGFGGKMAIDATAVDPAAPVVEVPQLPEGFRTDLLEKWGLAVVFAAPDAAFDTPAGVKYLAVFDPQASELTPAELLWLAAANTDPRRDIYMNGSTLVIDARSKRPAAGGQGESGTTPEQPAAVPPAFANPSRFPNVVTASEETIDLVDSRWSDYGLGDLIESPSRRYGRLLLCEGAQW
ncbi:menaquinone biosynthesis decarboxylase [uncultured Alistipes sp.]|uniref:menaquinone biosynthesis decarboxylase n=1 Tax=uncultured Alistipes sp. TaxID=538949 RepID=UPI0025E7EB66|nr:menaquinone biosynthesis decarboxylase [uncultured Alistipes sp.]